MSGQDNPQDQVPPAVALGQLINGYIHTQAISVAASLGLADLLKDGPKSGEELAASADVHPEALGRLLRALASLGLVTEVVSGRFTLTPLGSVLRTDAPGSQRAWAIFCGADFYWRAWGELLYSVKTGKSAFERVFGAPFYDYLSRNPEADAIFGELMRLESSPTWLPAAYDFSAMTTVVDVAGSLGAVLAAVLRAYPHLRGVLFDRPSVLERARQYLAAEGVLDRCELVAGDYREAVPGGANAYILRWIISDWDDDRAVALLQTCRRAMKERGKVLVIEELLNNELFDLHMLMQSGSRGRGRTEAEYRALYAAAGFRLTRAVPTESPFTILEGVPI